MTADRRKRHLKILELISTRAIHTQEELAEALASEGWEVTQSSVRERAASVLSVSMITGALITALGRPGGALARTFAWRARIFPSRHLEPRLSGTGPMLHWRVW